VNFHVDVASLTAMLVLVGVVTIIFFNVVGTYRKSTVEMFRQNSEAQRDRADLKEKELTDVRARLLSVETELKELKATYLRIQELNMDLMLKYQSVEKANADLKEENKRLVSASLAKVKLDE
jgi:cell shape-determining protein MreC